MSSSADARVHIGRLVVALERACLAADVALHERRWTALRAAFDEQTRLTAALAAAFDAAPDYAPQRDTAVAARLAGIATFRGAQLERLQRYRDAVRTRLEAIGRANQLARSLGAPAARARLIDGSV